MSWHGITDQIGQCAEGYLHFKTIISRRAISPERVITCTGRSVASSAQDNVQWIVMHGNISQIKLCRYEGRVCRTDWSLCKWLCDPPGG